MSTTSLGSLLKQAPRDERGVLLDSPEKKAFVKALAAAKPFNPMELLGLAVSLRSDPKRSRDADTVALYALTAIAHDRDCRRILGKVGLDLTPWNVTVNQLRAQINQAYRSPDSGAAWLEISDSTRGINVPEGSTLYFAPPESKQSGANMFIAVTCSNGKLYVAPAGTEQ